MLRKKQFPAWLVRRSYFKRIGRWLKPSKSVQPHDTAAAARVAHPSNVVPFPEKPGTARRILFGDLCKLGTA